MSSSSSSSSSAGASSAPLFACAISGVLPTEPVISRKSGHIFEKRLIAKHIAQHGTCPVTNQELTDDDLLPVNATNAAVQPRPAQAASVPGMLQLFQSEWDALMLETFSLKKHLASVRQELAHALYQHDAACRVIARLVKERDQARAAAQDVQKIIRQATSSSSSANGSSSSSSSSQQQQQKRNGQTATFAAALDAKHAELSAQRRALTKQRSKQTPSADALKKTLDTKPPQSQPLHTASKPGVLCVDVSNDANGELIATGGVDTHAIVFDRQRGKIVSTLRGHKKSVVDVSFHATRSDVLATASLDHTCGVWTANDAESKKKWTKTATLSDHGAPVIGCEMHPTGQYVLTASSSDALWNFYDIAAGGSVVASHSLHNDDSSSSSSSSGNDKVELSSIGLHPDGVVLGAGASDSLVRLFDLKTQGVIGTLAEAHEGAITSVAFCENGYYMASGDANGVATLWDLRVLKPMHNSSLKGAVSSLAFSDSGAFLAAASGNTVTVNTAKKWQHVATLDHHTALVTGVAFGPHASFLATTSKDRTLQIFSS